MALIITKWIAADAVTDSKILLGQNSFLRGRNAADSADVNIIKVNASDKLEVGAELDMGGFAISNVGNVDGVDVSALKSAYDGHVDGGSNKHDASEIDVEVAGNYTTVADLETNLGDLDSQIKTNADAIALNTTHSTGDGSDHQDVADLATLSGVAANSVNLGAFTGSTIADNSTIKAAIQAVETEVELKVNSSLIGAANGIAPLGADSKISSSYLPSYVDDVIEVADYASLPGTGETGKIYVTIDTNETYRWSGSVYVEIATGDVASVNSKVGVVVLVTDDISDATSTNKWSTAAEKTKLGFISVTQAVDLDSMESGISTNAGNISTNSGNISTNAGAITSLQGALGSSDEASINYSSNNYVTDAEDVVTAIGDLDAQVKTNADAIANASAPAEEILTLDATDISNGYVDLAAAASSSASIVVVPVNGPMQLKGVDYTVSLAGGVAGVTRLTFAGDLASLLVATDKLIVRYSA